MKLSNALKDLLRPPYVWKISTLYFHGKELLRLGGDTHLFPNDTAVSQFKKYIVQTLNEKWEKEAQID